MFKGNQKTIRTITMLMLVSSIFAGSSFKSFAAEVQKTEEEPVEAAAEIFGNGKHFVKYNGKVYFRVPTKESMKLSAIYGDYDNVGENSTCTIMEMDSDTLESEALFEDMSHGPLVISGDRFILSTDHLSGQYNVRSVSFDGKNTRTLPGSYIFGTQPSGKYFITGGFELRDLKLHLYICNEDGNYKEAVPSDRLYNYAGISETELFCITRKDQDAGSLSGFDLATGKETVYGPLPQIIDNEARPGEFKRLVEEDGYVYLQFAAYRGARNFYAGSSYVRVKCGEADSLEEVTPEGATGNSEDERYAHAISVKDGKLYYVAGKPNTATLDSDGNIGFYDENGEFVEVASGYGTETDYETEGRTAAEVIEDVDDYIYVIQNKERRVPDDDDGLRYAYQRELTSYIRVNKKTGESLTIGYCENTETDETDSDQTKKADDTDPLHGLVKKDILKKFRVSNPYKQGNTAEDEARRLGFWVKDSIGREIPESIQEQGDFLSQSYTFYFGTGIGNNLNNNFASIYQAYYALKYYYRTGKNKEFYNKLIEDNAFYGDGNPQTIHYMYYDIQKFVTECNNIIRRK